MGCFFLCQTAHTVVENAASFDGNTSSPGRLKYEDLQECGFVSVIIRHIHSTQTDIEKSINRT